MNNQLQTGDVIEMKEGMKISASIPAKFVYMNRRFSETMTKTEICIGQVRKNTVDVEEVKLSIEKKVKDAFQTAAGFEVADEAVKSIVDSILPTHVEETFDGSEFKGEFLVIKTAFDGGSSDIRDSYPNGHHVFAKKLKDGKFDPDGIEISFYQSGCFTNTILPSEIQPTRKLTMTFN